MTAGKQTMDKTSRREAIRQYKELKPEPGLFAVRCAPSGETWVGVSRNLGRQQNGIWFSLKHGGHPNRALQTAWNTHGEAAFAFEVLEVVDDRDLGRLGLDSRLKDRDRHWRETLGAGKVAG